MNPHAAGNIGMEVLDLEIIGLPGFPVDRLERICPGGLRDIAFGLLIAGGRGRRVVDIFAGNVRLGTILQNNGAAGLQDRIDGFKPAIWREKLMSWGDS